MKTKHPNTLETNNKRILRKHKISNLAPSITTDIAFISTFPPKVCGIATYSQDLKNSLKNKFGKSFHVLICPIESETESYEYDEKPFFRLNTSEEDSYLNLALEINKNPNIELVLLQHEFGLFSTIKKGLPLFLRTLSKKLIIAFHTVLPTPSFDLKVQVQDLADHAEAIIVMTEISKQILMKDYQISADKITVIPHGTHLTPLSNKKNLKEKYDLAHKKVLSTFGLLGSGKNLETTILALPKIINENPEVIFLIIGKTHPEIIKKEGESYRESLKQMITKLHLEQHVRFINAYLPLDELLEYLQLTDVYLFTSKDRNQAVSGTFSYAISCGCPIISTPIPHAIEVLKKGIGIIIDFESPHQLAQAVNKVLNNEELREKLSSKALEKMSPTAWENSAILHALLLKKNEKATTPLQYNFPKINLTHIKNMTTDFGIIQFSKINKPDLDSGYTLDDNARALIAMVKHYKKTEQQDDLPLIHIYLNFIAFCLQKDGSFLNYVNQDKEFTTQNKETNLEDSNGRAIWALGFLVSHQSILPKEFSAIAEKIIKKNLPIAEKIHSTRAMAFIIKGLYYQNNKKNISLLNEFATRLAKMYKHEFNANWHWYESYLTYGNSVLPEAMLCAWIATGDGHYKHIAHQSFQFLLSKIFAENEIKVISNRGWLQKDEVKIKKIGGEQPIDVAYTILALSKFYHLFNDKSYSDKMHQAFHWFLGKNHLHQIIYNPSTGGCYDGLEEKNVNLNQGAESTVSYLMARLSFGDEGMERIE